jgi:hypothetical protein
MSLYSSSITYLLVIIISLTCQSLQSIPIRTEQSKGKTNQKILFSLIFPILESFIQNAEEFIPTDEWQTVKEGIYTNLSIKQLTKYNSLGQAVPPGLHIRLNLETGIREAKLLDDNKPSDLSNSMVAVASNDNAQEQISKQNLERAFAHLDLSKDDVIPDEVNSRKCFL